MRRFAPLAALVSLTAQPALADLTPDQAWANWTAQIRALGLTLEATETHEGAALQIGNMTLSGKLPEGLGTYYLSSTGPRFEPVGDGTVKVTYPDVRPVDLGGALKGKGSAGASLAVRCDGLRGTMSGTPDQVISDYSAARCRYSLVSAALNGEALNLENADFRFVVENLQSQVRTETGDTHLTIVTSGQTGSLDVGYRSELPDKGKTVVVESVGTARNMDQSIELVLPKDGIDPLGLHEQLRAGLSAALKAKGGAGDSHTRVTRDGKVIQDQTFENGATDVYFTLDSTGFSEGGTYGSFSTRLETAELPIPVELSSEDLDFHLKVPLLMGEDQDANLRIALSGLTLGDDLWALIDPVEKLPRDPMSVAFDLGAKVSILFDFLDIRAIMAGAKPPAIPVMVKTARLDDLRIAGAGAELAGHGDVTLDYSDMETFDGMPAPDGQAAVTIAGAQGLLDSLVEMGLLPEDQATGARMILAMFTRATGDDTVTSEVEVSKTGEVTVNGQRVK